MGLFVDDLVLLDILCLISERLIFFLLCWFSILLGAPNILTLWFQRLDIAVHARGVRALHFQNRRLSLFLGLNGHMQIRDTVFRWFKLKVSGVI